MRVWYWASDGTQGVTPFRAAREGTDTLVVVGLRANTAYSYQVEAVRHGMGRRSAAASFQTAGLPAGLSAVRLANISGYTSSLALTVANVDSGPYAVAFDASGAVVWYHDFSMHGKGVLNVVQQSNGNFTAFLGATTGWQPDDGYYVEVTPEGQEVAEYRAPAGYYMDNHDFLITGTGAAKRAHFFTYSIRTMDLSSAGAKSSVGTAGHQLVRMNASGDIEFMWDAWDHIAIDEWVTDYDVKSWRDQADFDHPNSLVIDPYGNYVVSWRNLSQVMAIDSKTGDIKWRIGGAKGDYVFLNDPDAGFSKQHSAKILTNGNLLVYDNGTDHTPAESRAVEYQLDENAKTATLVWQYRHSPALYTPYVGWTERLKNGNTWVGFSFFGRAVEVDRRGHVVWEGQLQVNGLNTAVYRIVPIAFAP